MARITAFASVNKPQTLFDKVWAAHVVSPETPDTPAVLYVDMHFAHEVSTPMAFDLLRSRGLAVRRPDLTVSTLDHSTPTLPPERYAETLESTKDAARQVRQMQVNTRDFGLELFDMNDSRRGIVHVIGPELGITQPGMTIVCGDSHTSTHGAFGALAFGIGTTESAHVLATQCLLQRKPKTFEIRVDGRLAPGVTAKDLILGIIGRVGVGGATGHAIEYCGAAIRALSMEERMTVCNMSIEAGARAGMIAPDATTFSYMAGRPRSPHADKWQQCIERWLKLPTDDGANFDATLAFDASQFEPMITYGTNPAMVLPITECIPEHEGDSNFNQALRYMGFERGEAMLGKPIDVVFIGSCTNGRLEDLCAAARILEGRKVAPGVRLLIVPGSQQVKREAEALGLAQIFASAGADWRESGCSMCLGMNGDTVESGKYSVSTSNRNFEGRQGRGARTLLASPLTAAASAVNGSISDPRDMI